ncbi:unnamed protein product, partial [Owenia fusiformis]
TCRPRLHKGTTDPQIPSCLHSIESNALKNRVSTVDDIWEYLRNTMVPSLYAENMYNGENITHLGIASDLATVVVGVVRLRQQRIEKGTCEVNSFLRKQFSYCTAPFTWTNEDSSNYGRYWGPQDVPPSQDIWSYQKASKLNTLPLAGEHRTYSGGGYILELTKSRRGSQNALDGAKTDGWVDERTRVIIVEYTTFNPNTNLFSMCTLMFEFLTTGQIGAFYSILTVKLYSQSNDFVKVMEACEIIFVIILLISTVREVKSVRAHGELKAYFQSDNWKYFELLEILMSYSAIAVFFNRLVIVNDIIAKFHDSKGEGFVSFYPAVFWNYILNYIFAFLMILNVLKLFKMLNFNTRMSMLSNTLMVAGKPLINFFIMLAIIIMAHSHFAILYYGASFEEFSSGMNTIITFLHMLLAEFDAAHIMDYSLLMSIIFIVVFFVSVYLMILNLMLAILDDSFTTVRRIPTEREIMLSFVARKFKVHTGLKNAKFYQKFKKFWVKNVNIDSTINGTVTEEEEPNGFTFEL